MKLTLLEVTTNGEQDPEPPWAYRKIYVQYRLDFNEAERSCPRNLPIGRMMKEATKLLA